jgi:hypothetical protein
MNNLEGAAGVASGNGGETAGVTAAGAGAPSGDGGRWGVDDTFGRQVIAFGSLPALEGETLEACVERHRAFAEARHASLPPASLPRSA